MAARPPIDRFMEKIEVAEAGCWLWTASCGTGGYGQLGIPGKGMVGAHRFAYEHFVGAITEGLTLDHLCRVRRCCNPKHLEPVTRGENVLRGEGFMAQRARATHCQHGHELTAENLIPRSDGRRRCRTCYTADKKRWEAENLAKRNRQRRESRHKKEGRVLTPDPPA